MKTSSVEQDLLNQARLFYYQSCAKIKIKPITVNQGLSEVHTKIILLKNIKGEFQQISYARCHFIAEISGNNFYKRIQYPEPLTRTKYALLVESQLFYSFKELAKMNKIPVNVLIEHLISTYLEQNKITDTGVPGDK